MEDLFRMHHRQLTETEQELITAIKMKANELAALIPVQPGQDPRNRAFAIARTNLQQSVMWAVNGITG